MRISELIDGIRNRDLALPEFQREYVWSREQAKQLMLSLVKRYPVGSLLFWKTDQPPELKNLHRIPEKLGTIQVILDGQQRLTTLYLLITGGIPPYYNKEDLQMDPRDLFYCLETRDLQYYQASLMKDNPVWWRVTDCFGDTEINVFAIAKRNGATDRQAFDLAQIFNRHLNHLHNIVDIELPVQMVPSKASLNDAIDIFDRVNSQGTKLTDAELALTHVTGQWAQARRVMKAKMEDLSRLHFSFDLMFMTRALTGVATKRALFQMIHDRSQKELVQGWARLVKILDYLVTILPQRAFIHSTEDLNTTNVLVPLVVYLSLHDDKFTSDLTIKHAVHWLYAAHTWSRYTAQTDQRLEHDVSLVVRDEFPWDALRDQIIDQRGRIEVKANDLEGRGAQHPLYRMTFILAKAYGSVDWFNGAPLGSPHGQAYRIHSHHIFPQALLYNSGYDPDNHLHRKMVNEIANRAFLTADTNLIISAQSPAEYLSQVEKCYPGALLKQFIPMDPQLWKVQHFSDFLDARRQLIARKLNEFMTALITEPRIVRKRSVGQLIRLGQSATLEFKTALQWDMAQNLVNKDLHRSILKTIAAFLNSQGGTLVIGVEEHGQICGLENDLKDLDGSLDRYEQLLNSLVSETIGAEYAQGVKIRFETIANKKVCVIDTVKASEPVFLQGQHPGEKEFYIRLGSTTRSLDPEEASLYIQSNWE